MRLNIIVGIVNLTHFMYSIETSLSPESSYREIEMGVWQEGLVNKRGQEEKSRACKGQRVVNENVIGMLKRFKAISDKYRSRGKRFESSMFCSSFIT